MMKKALSRRQTPVGDLVEKENVQLKDEVP